MEANINLPEILERQQPPKPNSSYAIGSFWKSEYGERVEVIEHLGSMVIVKADDGNIYSPLSLSPL